MLFPLRAPSSNGTSFGIKSRNVPIHHIHAIKHERDLGHGVARDSHNVSMSTFTYVRNISRCWGIYTISSHGITRSHFRSCIPRKISYGPSPSDLDGARRPIYDLSPPTVGRSKNPREAECPRAQVQVRLNRGIEIGNRFGIAANLRGSRNLPPVRRWYTAGPRSGLQRLLRLFGPTSVSASNAP